MGVWETAGEQVTTIINGGVAIGGQSIAPERYGHQHQLMRLVVSMPYL